MARLQRPVDSPRDRLANHRAHATANKPVLHHAENDIVWAQHPNSIHDGVVETSLLLCLGEASLVGFQIRELQRISGAKFQVHQLVPRLQKVFDTGASIDAKVVSAMWANLLVGLKLCFEEDLAAIRTTNPQTFGADRLLRIIDDLVVFALKPTHCCACPLNQYLDRKS